MARKLVLALIGLPFLVAASVAQNTPARLNAGGRIFAERNGSLVATDARSGRVLWRRPPPDGYGFPYGLVADTLIWSRSQSGAITYTEYVGFDASTGAKRWVQSGEILARGGNHLAFEPTLARRNRIFNPTQSRLVLLHAPSGGRRYYVYEVGARRGCGKLVEDDFGATERWVRLEGSFVYLGRVDGCGRFEARFQRDQDPSRQRPTILAARK